MAIQSVQIDPNATIDQTGDEIVTAIDAGASAITRESALDQDSLNLVKTGPPAGAHKVKNVHRTSGGLIDVEYDDVPES